MHSCGVHIEKDTGQCRRAFDVRLVAKVLLPFGGEDGRQAR
jgi:hypothetical protein